MSRQVAIQIVAMLVVLSILVRWGPRPAEGRQNKFGVGDVHTVLDVDARLAGWPAEGLQRRALTRAIRRRNSERWFGRWMSLLERHQEIVAEADASTFVQFKGMGRNDQWPMIYDFYPIPTNFYFYEDGSRADDPTTPGAAVITGGMLQMEDLPMTEQLEVLERRTERILEKKPR